MTRWLLLATLVFAGCPHPTSEAKTVADSADRDPEVETRIALLQLPFGGGPHEVQRKQAAEWLVAHADRAYPRLLSLLTEGGGGRAVIELIPTFQRAESVPALEKLLLSGSEVTAEAAARSLARQPEKEAGEALHRALVGSQPAVARMAADALAARGNPADCAALRSAVKASDPITRYHVVRAAGARGCLRPEELDEIGRTDPDAEVRDLAKQLRARK